MKQTLSMKSRRRMGALLWIVVLGIAACSGLLAQQQDAQGEEREPERADVVIPEQPRLDVRIVERQGNRSQNPQFTRLDYGVWVDVEFTNHSRQPIILPKPRFGDTSPIPQAWWRLRVWDEEGRIMANGPFQCQSGSSDPVSAELITIQPGETHREEVWGSSSPFPVSNLRFPATESRKLWADFHCSVGGGDAAGGIAPENLWIG